MRRLFPTGQVIRFGITGILATATHYLVLRGLVEGAGAAPTIATALAFMVAVLVTYIGQSRWVFRQRLRSATGIGKFLTTALGGLIANVVIMFVAVDLLSLHYLAGFLTALVVVPAGTFVISKLWVFNGSG